MYASTASTDPALMPASTATYAPGSLPRSLLLPQMGGRGALPSIDGGGGGGGGGDGAADQVGAATMESIMARSGSAIPLLRRLGCVCRVMRAL